MNWRSVASVFFFSAITLSLATGCRRAGSDAQGTVNAQKPVEPPNSVLKKSPEETSCGTFIQDFYDWYVKAVSTDALKQNSFSLSRVRPHAMSIELQKMLDADYRASANNPDEIVGLDFDPFLASQDPSAKFTVESITIKNGSCIGLVRGIENGNKMESVEPELVRADGGWKFVNFHYPPSDASDPKESDLISVLKNLRNDRRKQKQ